MILPNMPIEEYHAHTAISKSRLDDLHRSPAHYREALLNPPEPTPAMKWGQAYHSLILQPDLFLDVYAVIPEDIDRRTKEGKAIWQEFVAANPDKEHIDKPTMQTLQSMREVLLAHPYAARALTGGQAEHSFFWSYQDVECRCRPDYINEGVLWDLKTTVDARPEAFSRAVWNFRYHVQAPFYLDGYYTATGESPEAFVFVAQEKTPPYAVAVYQANEAIVDQGRREYRRDLEVYQECLATDTWPSYPTEIQSILLPRWAAEEE